MQHNHHQHNEPDGTPKPGTFRLIMADPPWGHKSQRGKKLGAAAHYDLMTDQQILGMGEAVKHISAEDSWLLLWITDAVLPFGLEVMAAWGFTYHRTFKWVRRDLGMGDWPRTASEMCLVGKRGKPKPAFRAQPDWGFFPRQQHSKKPEEMFVIADRALGDPEIPRLELFARRDAPSSAHWDLWGNECAATVSLAKFGYSVPSDFDDQPAGQRLLPAGQENSDE